MRLNFFERDLVSNFIDVLDKIKLTKLPSDLGPGVVFDKKPFQKLCKILEAYSENLH